MGLLPCSERIYFRHATAGLKGRSNVLRRGSASAFWRGEYFLQRRWRRWTRILWVATLAVERWICDSFGFDLRGGIMRRRRRTSICVRLRHRLVEECTECAAIMRRDWRCREWEDRGRAETKSTHVRIQTRIGKLSGQSGAVQTHRFSSCDKMNPQIHRIHTGISVFRRQYAGLHNFVFPVWLICFVSSRCGGVYPRGHNNSTGRVQVRPLSRFIIKKSAVERRHLQNCRGGERR